MDEHRIGLKPILRRVWAPTGQPLICPVQPRYEWLYIYAFVCPESGESRFWLVPEVSKGAYQAVMTAFAQSVDAGSDHHVVVVEDGAGFHVCDDDGWPAGLHEDGPGLSLRVGRRLTGAKARLLIPAEPRAKARCYSGRACCSFAGVHHFLGFRCSCGSCRLRSCS